MTKKTEKICECGDTESQHIDGMERCIVPECGCKEFEYEKENKLYDPRDDTIAKLMGAIDRHAHSISISVEAWYYDKNSDGDRKKGYSAKELDATAFEMLDQAEYLINDLRKLRDVTQSALLDERMEANPLDHDCTMAQFGFCKHDSHAEMTDPDIHEPMEKKVMPQE
jgi:hypothetical protein